MNFQILKDIFYGFLLLTLIGCQLTDEERRNERLGSAFSEEVISAIPVKNFISEVRDETFLVQEKQTKKKQPKKIKVPYSTRSKNIPVPSQETMKMKSCLLYTSPSPRDQRGSRMPSSA